MRGGLPAPLAPGADKNVGQHRDTPQVFRLAQAYHEMETFS